MSKSVFELAATAALQNATLRGDLPPLASNLINFGLAMRESRVGRSSGSSPAAALSTSAATSQAKMPKQSNPLSGGISPAQARKLHKQFAATEYAKGCLFFLRIRSLSGGGETADFNFFATSVSYSPSSTAINRTTVGSGNFAVTTNAEAVTMRVTTLDDMAGTVKRWFEAAHGRMCKKNGLYGLPIDYLLSVEVAHAVFSEEANGFDFAYKNKYVMQPANIEYELDRRTDGLQELSMTFEQFSTF